MKRVIALAMAITLIQWRGQKKWVNYSAGKEG